MKHRLLVLLLSVAMLFPQLAVSTMAAAASSKPAAPVTSLADLSGKPVGVVTGVVLDKVITDSFGGKPTFYAEASAALEDVRQGRIAGFITDLSAARVIAANSSDLRVLEVPPEDFSLPIGAFSMDQSRIDSFNEFLAGITADGTLTEIQNRWLSADADTNALVPEVPNSDPPTNGHLTVATTGTAVPFSFTGKGGELTGFAVELAKRYAAWAGMELKLVPLDFTGLIPYVASRKADLGIEGVSITPERQEQVIFSDPIYDDTAGVLVLGTNQDPEIVAPAGSASDELTWQDFVGKRFAVKEGSVYDAVATKDFNASEVLRFEDYPSIYEAVLTGKADVGMRSYLPSRILQYEDAYSDLGVLRLTDEQWALPFGAISMDQDLVDAFNSFIADLKASPTYDEMVQRWFVDFHPPEVPEMPDIPLTGENGTFRVAVSSDYLPLSFLGPNNAHVGFDIELATRFAAAQGKDIEFHDMAFSALLPYVISKKADFGISDIVHTAERAKQVLFTDIYYTDSSALLFRKDAVPAGKVIPDLTVTTNTNSLTDGSTGVGAAVDGAQGSAAPISGNWLQRGVERNLIQDSRWKLVVSGLGVTLLIALAAQVLGTVVGAGLCFVLLRRNRVTRGLGRAYCGLIHGTPVVVLLMIIYYVVFGSSTVSNVLIAIVAFTLVTAAAVAQTLKSGIESVDVTEIEAARSLGFSAFRTFVTVTLPQAVRRAMPGYLTGFVELVKATAIVGYIAIMDLTRAGDLIRSRTYDAYFPLLLVALIYLLVTTLLVFLFKRLLRRLHVGAPAGA